MVYSASKITIRESNSLIDGVVILYRGDKGIELQFEILESKRNRSIDKNLIKNIQAAYGQIIIGRDGIGLIISEVVPTVEGKISFVLTGDMIDETNELGVYDFQIRLFDETLESQITLPPVIGGIEIREPIASNEIEE